MPKTKAWKEVTGTQVSEESLWEITKNYNCYITKNHDLTLSTDPLNLTGLNTKRDSGVANVRAIGIGFSSAERVVKEKKIKKKAQVVRLSLRIKTKRQLPKTKCVAVDAKKPLTNNLIYSEHAGITIRAVVKSLQRDLKNYRRDLIQIALKRLNNLRAYKKKNKFPKKDHKKH